MDVKVSYQYPNRVNVLGVGVSAIRMDNALEFIEDTIAGQRTSYICVTGVHGVMESQSDPELRAIHNRAGMVTPDGMPLVWIGQRRGNKFMERVYGPDLLLAACERSLRNGHRHYFFGGAEGVADELAKELSQRFPGLQVAGTYCPPFRALTEGELQEVVAHVSETKADIVWVGLSTPKQERFMASMVGRMPAPVMIGVGAAFDFHSGRKRQAPYWMQRSGLEWFFRLMDEPGRLWKRYLSNNPRFVLKWIGQEVGLIRYELNDTNEQETTFMEAKG